MKKILITGVAGFIGFHLAKRLLAENKKIIGIDNLNNYYDTKIKLERLKILKKEFNFKYVKGDLKNEKILIKKLSKSNIECVYHFAGQAGVRYSIKKPNEYIKDNIIAYINLLEYFKNSKKIKAIFYASSSSIYGENPLSLSNLSQNLFRFTLSKLGMELISNVYFSLYNIKCIGLRFFTVYGPWGRPDMAYFKFCKLIFENKKIEIYNKGKHFRSFTYIDDVINNILILSKKIKKINFNKNSIFNIGNPKTESLNRFIKLIEKNLNKKAKKNYLKKQPGDVYKTKSNTLIEQKLFKFEFKISLERGIKKFVNWYLLKYEKK